MYISLIFRMNCSGNGNGRQNLRNQGTSNLSKVIPCDHIKTLATREQAGELPPELPLHALQTFILHLIEHSPNQKLKVNFDHFQCHYLTIENYYNTTQSHFSWARTVYFVNINENQSAPVIFNCTDCAFTTDTPNKFVEHHTLGVFAPDHSMEILGKTNSIYLMKIILSTFKKSDPTIYNPQARTAYCKYCQNHIERDITKLYQHAIEKHGYQIVPSQTKREQFYVALCHNLENFHRSIPVQ